MIEAPVQIPIGLGEWVGDPNGRIDGIAYLLCKNAFGEGKHEVLNKGLLHVSAFRNAQMVQVRLANGKVISVFNVHIHHEATEPQIRTH